MVTQRPRRFGATVLLVLTLLGALGVTAAAAAEPTAAPTLTGSFTLVDDGQTITYQASGFRRHEWIATWFTLPDQSVINGPNFRADELGATPIDIRIPRNSVSGDWALTVYGLEGRLPLVTRFTVIGVDPPPVPSAPLVTPTAGPAGSAFRFTIGGLEEWEIVSYWITAPDGTIAYALPATLMVGRYGVATLEWAPPAGSVAGRYVITVQGLSSHVARAVPFEVQR
jgi:hypothetical protein